MGTLAPPERPRFQALILILEACLSYVFWAMWSKDKIYSFPTFDESRWLPASFEYRGLCSHNPLIEGNQGNPEFTADQLIEIDRATKEKRKERDRVRQKALRANPTPAFKAWTKRHNERKRPKDKARQQNAIASKQYHCSTCDISFRDAAQLRRHNVRSRHRKKLEMGDSDYYCASCKISCRYLSDFNRHKKTKGHIQKTSC